MPDYIGPVLVTLRDLFFISFVGEAFTLCFFFGIILKLVRGDR